MRALIFAAGKGERMRPLTETTPKPLLEVGGRTLLERHLERLAETGFRDVVINTAHLAEQIHGYVGTGARWGLRVRISHEGPEPLETGGGMLHALPALGPEPFLAVNADVLTDYPFDQLPDRLEGTAHLVMVDNPPWRQRGDFQLQENRVTGRGEPALTFSGIGVYHPRLVAGQTPGKFSTVPLLEQAMAAGAVTGERYGGIWHDVGTPERLDELQNAGI